MSVTEKSLEIKKPKIRSIKKVVAGASVPTSFCPLINGKCTRLACQLWVSDGITHGCALFFFGVFSQKELEELQVTNERLDRIANALEGVFAVLAGNDEAGLDGVLPVLQRMENREKGG